MELPTPDQPQVPRSTLEDAEQFFQSDKYREDLQVLAKAKAYIHRLFGEEESLDYMINEIKKYFSDGKFSEHCYDYAEREMPQMTEAELAARLPKTADGKPIFSWRDLK